MNHLSPEYITAQLSNILATLQHDIDANQTKHQHELALLRQVIHNKDEEINALNLRLRKQRQTKKECNKESNASFKRITLAKKTNKNVSQFTSELTNVNMAESVLMDRPISNNQSTKNISNLTTKPNSSVTVNTVNTVKTPRLPKSKAKDKQNMVLSVKKLSIEKPKRRSNSSHQQQQQQQSKGQISKQKSSSKIVKSKELSSSEKRCINIVIPTANFSAYSIRTSKTNASQGANV